MIYFLFIIMAGYNAKWILTTFRGYDQKYGLTEHMKLTLSGY